jgi:hypothetical protein
MFEAFLLLYTRKSRELSTTLTEDDIFYMSKTQFKVTAVRLNIITMLQLVEHLMAIA